MIKWNQALHKNSRNLPSVLVMIRLFSVYNFCWNFQAGLNLTLYKGTFFFLTRKAGISIRLVDKVFLVMKKNNSGLIVSQLNYYTRYEPLDNGDGAIWLHLFFNLIRSRISAYFHKNALRLSKVQVWLIESNLYWKLRSTSTCKFRKFESIFFHFDPYVKQFQLRLTVKQIWFRNASKFVLKGQS